MSSGHGSGAPASAGFNNAGQSDVDRTSLSFILNASAEPAAQFVPFNHAGLPVARNSAYKSDRSSMSSADRRGEPAMSTADQTDTNTSLAASSSQQQATTDVDIPEADRSEEIDGMHSEEGKADVEMVEDPKPFHCIVCSSKFTKHVGLRVHEQRHHGRQPAAPGWYKCPLQSCPTGYSYKPWMDSHVRLAHRRTKIEDHQEGVQRPQLPGNQDMI